MRYAVLLILLVIPADLFAMPTFARRYRTSCATCHQAFPRLNGVGEAFRLNGFRFEDDERYRKVDPVELGDEAYKRLWPKALWPTDIPSTSPLSFILRMMGEADLDRSRQHNVTYLFPEEVELVWAGNLGDDIAFYGDVIFLQKDFGGEKLQSGATIKGWVQFQNLIDRHLNLRVGTVGTQSLGLFNARDANTYGTHYYLYTSWAIPTPDIAAWGLAEFEGNNFSIAPQPGIEVNGFGERWTYGAGVVNGNVAAPFSSPLMVTGMGSGGGSDVYAQFAYKIGGVPFDRSDEEHAAALTTGAEFWRDDAIVFSFFAYRGRATIRAVDLEGAVFEEEDSFWRFGAGAQQQWRDLSVSVAWTAGRNARPYGTLSSEPVRSRAWHVEGLYFVYPWLIPYLRYESVELDLPMGLPGLATDYGTSRWLVGAKAMIRPNVGLVAETNIYGKGARLEEGLDRTLWVLLSLSF